MLKNLGITFPALKMPDDDWAKRTHGVVGLPVNFLLNRNGQIVWRPVVQNSAQYDLLESAIDALITYEP